MIVAGIVLLLVALVVMLFVGLSGLPVDDGSRVTLELLGVEVQSSAAVLFLTGAVALALLELGVLATRAGLRSASRRRAEMQRLRRVEAEVQARQATDAQRNAIDLTGGAAVAGSRPVGPGLPVTPPAAPFTRRDSSPAGSPGPRREPSAPADRAEPGTPQRASHGPGGTPAPDPSAGDSTGGDSAARPGPAERSDDQGTGQPPPTTGG